MRNMNQQQFEAFLTRSKDLWELMETYRLAYVANSEASNKRAETLKWLTLVSGLVTGLCSIPLFLNVQTTEYVVAIFGTFTGSLTVADKYFRWEEHSTETWQRHKSLENLQRDLYHFTLDINDSTRPESISLYIQQLSDKSSDETSLRINNIGEWKNRANVALHSHGINGIKFKAAPDETDDIEEFITEDVEGIVEVARGAA